MTISKCTHVIASAIVLISSCSTNEKNTIAEVDYLNETLEEATISIVKYNAVLYNEINEQLYAPTTREKATTWHPVAMQIKENTMAIYSMIDSIKHKEIIDWNTINDSLFNYKKRTLVLGKQIVVNDSIFLQFIDSMLSLTPASKNKDLSL
jgi:GldM N-terminal domain